MNEVPFWMIAVWFWLSTVCMILALGLLVGLAVAGVRILRMLTEMKPKIESLEVEVKGVVQKVNTITETVQETVEALSGRAKSVAGAADIVARSASVQFQRYSPYVIGLMTLTRLLTSLRERSHQKESSEKAAKKPGRGGLPWTIAKMLLRILVK